MATFLRIMALILFITAILGNTLAVIPLTDTSHFELNVYAFLLLMYAKLLDIEENV